MSKQGFFLPFGRTELSDHTHRHDTENSGRDSEYRDKLNNENSLHVWQKGTVRTMAHTLKACSTDTSSQGNTCVPGFFLFSPTIMQHPLFLGETIHFLRVFGNSRKKNLGSCSVRGFFAITKANKATANNHSLHFFCIPYLKYRSTLQQNRFITIQQKKKGERFKNFKMFPQKKQKSWHFFSKPNCISNRLENKIGHTLNTYTK